MIDKNKITTGDYVWIFRPTEYEKLYVVDIFAYRVGWVGSDSFIPSDFQDLSEDYQIIYFESKNYILFESLNEATSNLESYAKKYGEPKLNKFMGNWFQYVFTKENVNEQIS